MPRTRQSRPVLWRDSDLLVPQKCQLFKRSAEARAGLNCIKTLCLDLMHILKCHSNDTVMPSKALTRNRRPPATPKLRLQLPRYMSALHVAS